MVLIINKRAEIGFQWILIGLMGIVILTLFFKLAMTQGKVSEKEMSIAVSSRISALLRESKPDSITYKRIPIPLLSRNELITTCMAKEGIYSSRIGTVTLSFSGAIPFLPPRVRDPSPLIITMPLRIPFYIGQGVSIIDSSTSINGFDIGIDLPSSTNGIIVCDERSSDCSDGDIIINDDFHITINGKTYPYIGDSMLKLAILSNKNYPCALILVNDSIKDMSKLLKERNELLMNDLIDQDCIDIFTTANNIYEDIEEKGIDYLINSYEALEILNRNAQIKGCPPIY